MGPWGQETRTLSSVKEQLTYHTGETPGVPLYYVRAANLILETFYYVRAANLIPETFYYVRAANLILRPFTM